jgi:molybdopterin-guanine dinucleotide biosynthesis protein A
MGTDKALLEVGGQRLLDAAVAALRPVAGRIVLATGADERYASLGFETVLDRTEGVGPLAGLLAGLEAADTEWCAVLACDMPRASSDELAALLRHAAQGGHDVCLLENEGGLEPLYGVYHRRCVAAIRAAIAAGERRMVSFHAGLSLGTLRRHGAGPALNVNTPGELDRAREETP